VTENGLGLPRCFSSRDGKKFNVADGDWFVEDGQVSLEILAPLGGA